MTIQNFFAIQAANQADGGFFTMTGKLAVYSNDLEHRLSNRTRFALLFLGVQTMNHSQLTTLRLIALILIGFLGIENAPAQNISWDDGGIDKPLVNALQLESQRHTNLNKQRLHRRSGQCSKRHDGHLG